MFKLFKVCVRVVTLGKLMSFIVPNLLKLFWRMGERKTELLRPLIRIFLEVIKTNKWGVRRIRLGSSPYSSEICWEGDCSHVPLPEHLRRGSRSKYWSPLETNLSSVWWNAALSGYCSLCSGCCVAQSNTSWAAVCPFVSAQEKETNGCSSVACKMISVSAGGGGRRRCDGASERDG